VREAEEAGTRILFSNSTATAVKWRKGCIVHALWISADDGQRECAGARGIISFRLYNIARDIGVPSPNALYPLILHLLPTSVIIEISFRYSFIAYRISKLSQHIIERFLFEGETTLCCKIFEHNYIKYRSYFYL